MNKLIKFDPLLFKFPKGVITKGNSVKFFLEVNDAVCPNEVLFMVKKDEDFDYLYLPIK